LERVLAKCGLYEVTDNKVTKYYSIAGMTVAMYSDNSLASTARAVRRRFISSTWVTAA